MKPNTVILKEYLLGLNLSNDAIQDIIPCFSVREYKKAEHFASDNKCCDKVGFVIKGLFYMYSIRQDGSYFTKEFLADRQFLLAAFCPGEDCRVNIQALKTSVILEAKYSDILLLYDKYHDMDMLGKKRLEKELEAMCQRMEEFAAVTSRERYISFREKYSAVEAEIPQYLVASYLGITPTQLSRIRAKLK